MLTDALIARHSEEIRRLGRQHGAGRLRVFGSRASRTAKESSDLDILAEFEPGRDLFDLIGLKQDLEALLGCRVDVVTESALTPYVRDQVLREAKVL